MGLPALHSLPGNKTKRYIGTVECVDLTQEPPREKLRLCDVLAFLALHLDWKRSLDTVCHNTGKIGSTCDPIDGLKILFTDRACRYALRCSMGNRDGIMWNLPLFVDSLLQHVDKWGTRNNPTRAMYWNSRTTIVEVCNIIHPYNCPEKCTESCCVSPEMPGISPEMPGSPDPNWPDYYDVDTDCGSLDF